MSKHLKYALDGLFLFMLFVSVSLFALGFVVDIDHVIIRTIKDIDFAVLGGYYVFFFSGLFAARSKPRYVRNHWILALFLIVPFVPIVRFARLTYIESAFGIGVNTLWHFLDELELM